MDFCMTQIQTYNAFQSKLEAFAQSYMQNLQKSLERIKWEVDQFYEK